MTKPKVVKKNKADSQETIRAIILVTMIPFVLLIIWAALTYRYYYPPQNEIVARPAYPGKSKSGVCYDAWLNAGSPTFWDAYSCERAVEKKILTGTRVKMWSISFECDSYIVGVAKWEYHELHYYYKTYCGPAALHSAKCDKDVTACPSNPDYFFKRDTDKE